MRINKKHYYLVCLVIFVLLILLTQPNSIRTILGSFAGLYLGVDALYGYIYKEGMSFGWFTVKYENNPIERLFYLVAALALIALAVIGLINKW